MRTLSGVQHVPGDSCGLHYGAQGGPAGLAVCLAHSAAEEDGSRSSGLCPGQSPKGPGYHKVGKVIRARLSGSKRQDRKDY